MDLIWDGVTEALRLIFSGDSYVYEVTFTSLLVSGSATVIALVIGLSIASFLAFRAPPGRTLALSAFNAGMALPPVAVGLLVSIMLWRTGPLGELHLLYSRTAIVIAQAVIATPVVAALSTAALQGLNPNLRLQVLALGASRKRRRAACQREAGRSPPLPGGATIPSRGCYGRIWSSHLRGRRDDNGRRQHQRLHPNAHLGHRPRSPAGRFRNGHRAV